MINKDNKQYGVRWYLHLYKMILLQDLKSKMSYRADFIISSIGMILTNLSGFVAFWIIFQNFSSINGWTFHEMLFMYGFSLLALTPVQCFFDNNWNLRQNVYSGDFIKYCFRPINIFFYYISEVFDIKGLGQFAFGFATIGYAWYQLQIPISLGIILLLIVELIFASLFMIAIMNLAAATNFWLMGSTFIMIFTFNFKDYARYPITIFGPVFRFVFTFFIPIAFLAYYPCIPFLRAEEIPALTYCLPVFGVLFFYLSYKVWMKGAAGYSGTGS